ncbi:MAG: DNA internalization-related competence protein ComEC/Rec2 [bacterium]
MGLLAIFTGMVTGILLRDIKPVIPVYAYVMIGILILFCFMLVKNKYVWLLLSFTTALMLATRQSTQDPLLCADRVLNHARAGGVNVSGWVVKPVRSYPGKHKIVIKIDKIHDQKNIDNGCLAQLSVFDPDNALPDITSGDYINAHVRLHRPKNLKNPGSFDYVASLSRDNIALIGYLNSVENISISSDRAMNGFFRSADSIRIKVRHIIAHNVDDPLAYSIVLALVIGDQGYISSDVRRMFSSTGIIHILVVAGLHLAIITHLFYRLIRFLLSRSVYLCLHINIPKLSLVLSLIPMTAYTLLTGANPPVVRSGIMIAVYCILFIINRTQARWTGLLIAAILILTVNPMALHSVSFQLSFVAVGSIIAFMPVISRIVEEIKSRVPAISGKIFITLANALLVSIFVTIGLGGIIAYYFNTVPLCGILLNILVIPLFCYIIVPISLIASCSGFISAWLSHALFFCISYLINVIVGIISWVSALSIASIRVPTPTLFEICIYYSILIILLGAKRFGTRITATLLSVLMLFQILDIGYYVYKNHFTNKLSITFIDVGQGDSAFIEFPSGKTMLIDAGGGAYHSYDTGEAVVSRYIWALKRNKVDYIIASHPQIDHIGGLGFIIKNMGVKEVYQSDCEPETNVYKDFVRAIHKARPNLYKIKDAVRTLEVNGVKVELLPVPHDVCDPYSEKDLNNYAVITRLVYRQVSILFTGDIEKKAEELLVDKYNTDLKADILKVAHHGSKTSSSERFLDAVGPKIAIISVGETNPFHMPSKAVLKRLFERNVNVYRTDRQGAIRITTDGRDISIKTYSSGL